MIVQNDQQRSTESASEIKLSVSTMAYGLAKKGVITPAEADGLSIMVPKLIATMRQKQAQAKQQAVSQGQPVPQQRPMGVAGPAGGGPPGMMQRPGMGGGPPQGPGLQRFSPNARGVPVR